MNEQILHGPIISTLFRLGWPIMLSNAFQTLYNLVDTYWVGKLGTEAVAAITPSWPIIFLFMSLAIGFTVAGVSLVSQYTGSGQQMEKNIAAGQVFSFMLISSVIIAIFGFFFTGHLLTLMGVPSDVHPKSKAFLQTIFLGMPAMFTYFSFRSLMRAYGDTITPMLLTGTSVLIDFLLDPFFILGWNGFPRLELQGAAIATVIARSIAAVIAVYLLFSGKKGLKLQVKYVIPQFTWLQKVVGIGAPASASRTTTAIGFVILTSFVAQGGEIALSVYGIGSRITRLINVITWGLTAALTTMIGQNLGAQQEERAEAILKTTVTTLFLLTGMGAAMVYLLRGSLYRMFISDAAVIQEGRTFLGIFALSVPFFGLFMTASSVFRGAGRTNHSLVLSIIRLWGIRILCAYVLFFVFEVGVIGLWIGISLGNFLGGVIAMAWVSCVHWQERIIEETYT